MPTLKDGRVKRTKRRNEASSGSTRKGIKEESERSSDTETQRGLPEKVGPTIDYDFAA